MWLAHIVLIGVGCDLSNPVQIMIPYELPERKLMGHRFIRRHFRDDNFITDSGGYSLGLDIFLVHVNREGDVTVFDSQDAIASPHYLLLEKIVNWVKTLDLNNLIYNKDDEDEFFIQKEMVDPPQWISDMLERT